MDTTTTLSKHEMVIDRAEYETLKAKKTFDSYFVDKQSTLLYHLDGGVQEEHLVSMAELLEELEDSDEFEVFKSEVDTSCDDCLLLKGW